MLKRRSTVRIASERVAYDGVDERRIDSDSEKKNTTNLEIRRDSHPAQYGGN
jgi:hypothetical protein